MMKSYWKQFVEWVIELRDDPFVGPRIKFTIVNFVVIIIIFAWGNLLLDLGRENEIRQQLTGRFPDSSIEEAVIQETVRGLRAISSILFFSIALGATLISYFLAGITLGPIKQIIRAQKRFIADASHELRTPLSIIKADSEIALLDGDDIAPKEAGLIIKSNLEEVDRMSKIIDNLLNLSFYDTTATEIPFTKVDMVQLATNLVHKTQSLARNKDVTLTVSSGIKTAAVTGNATALEQMAMNLIRNAILYTPQGGSVLVSVEKNSKEAVELKVKDTGIGISPKDLPNILSPFYKGEQTKSREGS
ncbi:MAG: histidine kinase dimerization/phospho-acceptor domain-containing protein, partial [Candidatus Yanofskybacteria bacterium]|nr:histidine kinase dimerization/phospho-acceptor domain-containing protein [Candidatus Yanofskybacteria bacterium]